MVPVALDGMAGPYPGAVQPGTLLGPWNAVVLQPHDSMFRGTRACTWWLDLLLEGCEASSAFSTVSGRFFPVLFPHPGLPLFCIFPFPPNYLCLPYFLETSLVGYLLILPRVRGKRKRTGGLAPYTTSTLECGGPLASRPAVWDGWTRTA